MGQRSFSCRSPQQVAELIQQRVKERDSWVQKPSDREMMSLAINIVPKVLRFQVPSQNELDETFPVHQIDWEAVLSPPDDAIQITWLGHASLLVQMNGLNLLTDPVFSDRCSPIQWFFGPKRFRPPPCTLDDLVSQIRIDAVLISHNHYDHLDFTSVRQLTQRSNEVVFCVPLGLRAWFERYVSSSTIYHELDWHETAIIGDDASGRLNVTAVPMNHWSNRTGDRDQTLWCGYSVASSQGQKFLFTGDTGWFDEMDQEIGARYGPFDLAAIPIGAYEPRHFMKYSHINVEEAVRMKDILKVRTAVPIHWGTFPLTTEPVLEPRQKLVAIMKDRKDRESFQPWSIGETTRSA